MKPAPNIYLIGLMGVGKTTIGKQVAKAMQWPFYDSDKVIEETTGTDIPTIFAYEGEEGFRNREQAMIRQLTGLDGIVMATGGGSILRPENREALKTRGFVVYLHCSIDKILHRTKHDTQRPLLRTENPRQRLQELFAIRDPLYRECADFRIDSGMLPGKTVVKTILQQYQAALENHERAAS
ncbi:shikimate kinase [Methylomonas sp. MED-D]|uniref:Shikimate kinase n=1 Tax=Methylomonas koyamae TaxID=702114 RepID=A0A177PDD4_9GAMM|nr:MULTISPECIES: shikimate kinase [Methylomonas]MDT4330083.1 shikimate kinase [Methylomonas sp. MV1]OAI28328.1 shikimate kinase [Methylomonas koyamae]OHX37571.1 shikimate kinase [Methylomonas sp. LWB]WGS86786.1 shikimate kinase [Methylomonas sp. UP202]